MYNYLIAFNSILNFRYVILRWQYPEAFLELHRKRYISTVNYTFMYHVITSRSSRLNFDINEYITYILERGVFRSHYKAIIWFSLILLHKKKNGSSMLWVKWSELCNVLSLKRYIHLSHVNSATFTLLLNRVSTQIRKCEK